MHAAATRSASYATLLLFAAFLLAPSAVQAQSNSPAGCFSSSEPLTDKGSYTWQSTGYCAEQCAGSKVFALTNGESCLCGDQLPAAADKVSDSSCNVPCQGYGKDTCGGDGFYQVYTIGGATVDNYSGGGSGGKNNQGNQAKSSTSTSIRDPQETPAPRGGSKPTATAAVITSVKPGTTIRVTLAPTAEATSESSSKSGGGGTNTAGIAAGVVVGVVAIAAIIGFAIFFVRRRRRQQAAEDYARDHQKSEYMRGPQSGVGIGGRPPASGYSQMSDSRLDANAAGANRNSSGSIADAEDYSRKILRVANPDRD